MCIQNYTANLSRGSEFHQDPAWSNIAIARSTVGSLMTSGSMLHLARMMALLATRYLIMSRRPINLVLTEVLYRLLT